jgi:hypothetical protein
MNKQSNTVISSDVRDFYTAQVNALVDEDREDLISSLTDDYDRLLAAAERQNSHSAG